MVGNSMPRESCARRDGFICAVARLPGFAEVYLEIGGSAGGAVDGDVIGDVGGERAGEPAGLLDDLVVAVEEGHTVVDRELAIDRGADGDGDEEDGADVVARRARGV